MANINSIYSVGKSIVSFLDYAYRQPRVDSGPLSSENNCVFRVLRSSELDTKLNYDTNLLSLYLYRVTTNDYLKNLSKTARLKRCGMQTAVAYTADLLRFPQQSLPQER
jgi:hypothetical protein